MVVILMFLLLITLNVPIEVMVFIIYSDEITIDVKTGLVLDIRTKYSLFNIIISIIILYAFGHGWL
jgi:hypothetical protein